MRWGTVILLALATGIYTGAVLMIDNLKDTSFQDIGIYYEWWVIFAVLIVVNCRKNWEAMLKCFMFFLVSQPVVFAVETLLGKITIEMAIYYFRGWLPIIFLTLPGGLIAFYCKRQSTLGAVILGLGDTILAVTGVHYAVQAVQSFPRHLLSAFVCFGGIFGMTFAIQRKAKNRCIAILISCALTAALLILIKLHGRTI